MHPVCDRSPLFVGLLAFPPDGYDPRVDSKTAASIANARDVSRNDRNLDPSEQETVVDSLTRGVPLIPEPAPPSTGKVRLSDIL